MYSTHIYEHIFSTASNISLRNLTNSGELIAPHADNQDATFFISISPFFPKPSSLSLENMNITLNFALVLEHYRHD